MLITNLLCLVISFLSSVQITCGKLRGHAADGTELRKHTKETTVNIKSYDPTEPEQYLHDYLEKLKNDLSTKTADQPHTTGVSSLEIFNTQETADLSYRNFAVARKRLNSDCTGPVISLAAQYLGCVRFGTMSMSANCFNSTFFEMSSYNSSDCSGEPLASMQDSTSGCSGGMRVQCMSKDEVPTFADKNGISTYKFRAMGDCKFFSATYLGYAAPYSSELVEFDDLHSDDDGARLTGNYEDGKACCMQSEILQYCPYPRCPSEAPVSVPGDRRRQLGNKVEPLQAVPSGVRTAHWWDQKTSRKDGSGRERVESAAAALSSLDSSVWYREYALAQQRTGVCAYDETYQIWVKTTCSNEADTLTYQLFADADCLFPMKKVVHPIQQALPHYGKCVESSKGDGRTMLVLCHGQNGFGTAPSIPT